MLAHLDLSRLPVCLDFIHIFKLKDYIEDHCINRLQGIYHS